MKTAENLNVTIAGEPPPTFETQYALDKFAQLAFCALRLSGPFNQKNMASNMQTSGKHTTTLNSAQCQFILGGLIDELVAHIQRQANHTAIDALYWAVENDQSIQVTFVAANQMAPSR